MAHARGGAPAGGSDAAKTGTTVGCGHPVHAENAGHGVVIPSGGGIPRVEHGRAIDVPRTSVRDDLMTDGEPMPSVKAVG